MYKMPRKYMWNNHKSQAFHRLPTDSRRSPRYFNNFPVHIQINIFLNGESKTWWQMRRRDKNRLGSFSCRDLVCAMMIRWGVWRKGLFRADGRQGTCDIVEVSMVGGCFRRSTPSCLRFKFPSPPPLPDRGADRGWEGTERGEGWGRDRAE